MTIIGNGASNATTTPIPSGEGTWLWSNSTTSSAALQDLVGTGRIAASWYSSYGFTVDIDFTDQAVHQVAIYCLDWNGKSRVETISVLDGTSKAVLDTRSVSNFTNGIYLLWNVTGHVKLRIMRSAGPNAVISGVFLK